MIRAYRNADAEQILAIYRPHIEDSAVSFETTVPSLEEFTLRLQYISDKFPLFVLEEDSKILGYAYATTYRSREAYQWSIETSIYMLPSAQGKGKSHKLYQFLLEELSIRGFQKAYAVITVPNDPSIKFHLKHGFEEISTFQKAGYKMGEWHAIHWMEKELNNAANPEPPFFGKKA